MANCSPVIHTGDPVIFQVTWGKTETTITPKLMRSLKREWPGSILISNYVISWVSFTWTRECHSSLCYLAVIAKWPRCYVIIIIIIVHLWAQYLFFKKLCCFYVAYTTGFPFSDSDCPVIRTVLSPHIPDDRGAFVPHFRKMLQNCRTRNVYWY